MTFATPELLVIAVPSPLIGLAKIGRLGVLYRSARRVWIPRADRLEVTAGVSGWAESENLISRFAALVRQVYLGLAGKFGREVDPSEAVVLAITAPGCLLLVDDAAEGSVAESEGIRCNVAGGSVFAGQSDWDHSSFSSDSRQ